MRSQFKNRGLDEAEYFRLPVDSRVIHVLSFELSAWNPRIHPNKLIPISSERGMGDAVMAPHEPLAAREGGAP